jgi:hypothetical protein
MKKKYTKDAAQEEEGTGEVMHAVGLHRAMHRTRRGKPFLIWCLSTALCW